MTDKLMEPKKHEVVERYLNGESVHNVCSKLQIPRSTFYSWINKYKSENSNNGLKAINLRNFRFLENRVKRLEGIIEILKMADCTASAPLKERLNTLEKFYGKYSVHMLCEALNVSRGTFYNHVLRNKRDNSLNVKRREELSKRIYEIYNDNKQIFGAKKIAAILKDEGITVSYNMVLELMRKMGLVSIRQDVKSIYKK